MTGGLVIRLRPHEKFLVNGAILENGEKRAKFRVKSPDVNILRLRDALHPDEITTPVKRLYYTAQLGVTGDTSSAQAAEDLAAGLDALYDAIPDAECREIIDQAREHTNAHEFYHVMRCLKPLLPLEEKLLLLARAKEIGAVSTKDR